MSRFTEALGAGSLTAGITILYQEVRVHGLTFSAWNLPMSLLGEAMWVGFVAGAVTFALHRLKAPQ